MQHIDIVDECNSIVLRLDISQCAGLEPEAWIQTVPVNLDVIPAVVDKLLERGERESLVPGEELFCLRLFRDVDIHCIYVCENLNYCSITCLKTTILHIFYEVYMKNMFNTYGKTMTAITRLLNMWTDLSDVYVKVLSDGINPAICQDDGAMKGVILC